MLKAYFIIVATFLVATKGLKCNKCFYIEGEGAPDFRDGQEHESFKFDKSCDWNKDVKSAYGGVECKKIGNIDPVCLVWRFDAAWADSFTTGHVVLRSCYNQYGGVSENELDNCSKRKFTDLMISALNDEIAFFFTGFETIKNQTVIEQDESTDVCLCNEDNCNRGDCNDGKCKTDAPCVGDKCNTDPPCFGDNCNGSASAITFSFLIIAVAGPLLYCLN